MFAGALLDLLFLTRWASRRHPLYIREATSHENNEYMSKLPPRSIILNIATGSVIMGGDRVVYLGRPFDLHVVGKWASTGAGEITSDGIGKTWIFCLLCQYVVPPVV
ncbi:hypothetical protein XPA_005823 [Xanthoria parietina]